MHEMTPTDVHLVSAQSSRAGTVCAAVMTAASTRSDECLIGTCKYTVCCMPTFRLMTDDFAAMDVSL